ncbi:hypothetical protein BB561_006314 [Smittium simulii]|uniref:MIR domain-containing protein n=1 Tax=Smittium simulii TaxID=133385 RepID=A0A2T9Y571_9FUNG|nr:hypothetical protein BB561_006314 [Smittium simulii]
MSYYNNNNQNYNFPNENDNWDESAENDGYMSRAPAPSTYGQAPRPDSQNRPPNGQGSGYGNINNSAGQVPPPLGNQQQFQSQGSGYGMSPRPNMPSNAPGYGPGPQGRPMGGPPGTGFMGGPEGRPMNGPPGPGSMGGPQGRPMDGPPGSMGGPQGRPMNGPPGPGSMGGPQGRPMDGPPGSMGGPQGRPMGGPPGPGSMGGPQGGPYGSGPQGYPQQGSQRPMGYNPGNQVPGTLGKTDTLPGYTPGNFNTNQASDSKVSHYNSSQPPRPLGNMPPGSYNQNQSLDPAKKDDKNKWMGIAAGSALGIGAAAAIGAGIYAYKKNDGDSDSDEKNKPQKMENNNNNNYQQNQYKPHSPNNDYQYKPHSPNNDYKYKPHSPNNDYKYGNNYNIADVVQAQAIVMAPPAYGHSRNSSRDSRNSNHHTSPHEYPILYHHDGDTHMKIGSVIALKHNMTGRLLRTDRDMMTSTGSNQNLVYCHRWNIEDYDKWQVIPQNKHAPPPGSPITYGTTVRLRHLETKRHLHSHQNFHCPMTGQNEITAFGSPNYSDDNDHWIVERWGDGGYGQNWSSDDIVVFRHASTGNTLHSHEVFYSDDVQSVTCFGPGREENDKWRVKLP